MEIWYWIFEYSKVFLAYFFLMFVWPSVVFGRILKGRSRTFRFAFCATVQVVLINTVVLAAGLIHLLNGWTMKVFFYGIFLYAVCRRIPFGENEKRTFKHLVTGTYGKRLFLSNCLYALGRGIRTLWRRFSRSMHSYWWEYGLLSMVLLYGMIYFTYGAFQDYSYGFGDMYTHSAWIYGLTQGKIFSAGVYPEAMHCFVYSMHTLFGIKIYSCMLFLAGIHVLVFLLSAYLLFKEVFCWRYTPIFVLTAFLTVDVVCINEIYSMSRLQWSLPQEFGLYTLFLCAAFLVRYSRSAKQIPRDYLRPFVRLKKFLRRYQKRRVPESIILSEDGRPMAVEEVQEPKQPRLTKGYWDENLFLFMMALAASLTIHFYPTIMAFFLCVAFVPTAFCRIFHRKRFLPLVATAVFGFLIAVVPMVGALMSGIPFQGSIGWAVNVINGTDGEGQTAIVMDEETGEEITGDLSAVLGQRPDTSEGQDKDGQGTGEQDTVQNTEPKEPLMTRIVNGVIQKSQTVYYEGYATLYRAERAQWIVGFTCLAGVIWAAGRIMTMLLKLILRAWKKERADRIVLGYFDGYLSITLASIIFMIMYCASSIGLPSLIAGSRLCSTEQMLILAMMAVPLDFLFTLLHFILYKGILKLASALCVAGIYLGTIMTGNFHGYLYFELTRYNGAVMTTKSIIDSLPENSYTIVSTTDEIYQIIQYGRHEELTNFVNESKRGDYTIPTEYIFIYVEKKPIEYAQSHFFTGPDWLAWEKYTDYYDSFVSQCPDITASEISKELSEQGPKWFTNSSKSYSNLPMRTMIESRANEWCREFEKLYPNEFRVYYEDENFVCYYFRQNTGKLYQLSIW